MRLHAVMELATAATLQLDEPTYRHVYLVYCYKMRSAGTPGYHVLTNTAGSPENINSQLGRQTGSMDYYIKLAGGKVVVMCGPSLEQPATHSLCGYHDRGISAAWVNEVRAETTTKV